MRLMGNLAIEAAERSEPHLDPGLIVGGILIVAAIFAVWLRNRNRP